MEIAVEMYTRLLLELNFVMVENNQQRNQVAKRKVAMALNIALAHIYSGLNTQAIMYCDSALNVDPKNEKALFRKADANRLHGCYGEAIKTLRILKEVNPMHPHADQMIKLCEHYLYMIRLRRLLQFDVMYLAICWV